MLKTGLTSVKPLIYIGVLSFILLLACSKDDPAIVLQNNQDEVPTVNDASLPENNEDPTPGDESPAPSSTANLLFKSGFEGVHLSNPIYDYQYITGRDDVTGFEWPPHILGSENATEPSGIHNVDDDNGSAIDNNLETVIGPNGAMTTTLFQRVNYDMQVTQAPYQINGIEENPDELYISYWMKTDAVSLQGIDQWRSIWTYKTKNYASNTDGFRMIAFMATDIRGDTYWMLQGDINPQTPLWQIRNTQIPLIQGEWFKVEYHFKWSNGEDGYAAMKVNGQLIGEHFGVTTANNDPLEFIMLTQVYGDHYPMYQWVDDVEIWDGLPALE